MCTGTAAGGTPVIALAHAYGTLGDFCRRLKLAYEAARRRVWVKRQVYVSDAKIAAIFEVCGASSA